MEDSLPVPLLKVPLIAVGIVRTAATVRTGLVECAILGVWSDFRGEAGDSVSLLWFESMPDDRCCFSRIDATLVVGETLV